MLKCCCGYAYLTIRIMVIYFGLSLIGFKLRFVTTIQHLLCLLIIISITGSCKIQSLDIQGTMTQTFVTVMKIFFSSDTVQVVISLEPLK